MSDLTLTDLLNEPCENFTVGTCADPNSGKIPDSDTGTWNQYCSACRLRYVMKQKEDTMNLNVAIANLESRVQEWDAEKISNAEFGDLLHNDIANLLAIANKMPDMSSYRTTLLATEAEALAAALKTLNDNVDKNAVISFGPQTVFDENGETLGRINFNGEAMAYVLEMDYIPENHTDA